MAKMALQGGFYYTRLRARVDSTATDLIRKTWAEHLTSPKLPKTLNELFAIRDKASGQVTYNELPYLIMRLGEIEREFSRIEFSAAKKD